MRPNWIKSIAHNFNNDELLVIEESAKIDSCKPIVINGMIIVPSMLGSPIIIPDKIKEIIKDLIIR